MLDAVTVDHALKEVANATWKALVKEHVIAELDAKTKMEALLSLARHNLTLADETTLLEEAFEIACRTGLTVYDSLYLALARRERISLSTFDQKQERAARELGLQVSKP